MALISFHSPENLVEGPRILFSIPCSEHFPFAMGLDDGKFGLPVSITVITTWVIMALFIVLFKWGTSKLSIKPNKKQTFLELLYTIYESIVEGTMGKWKKKYLLYIATLISFIFISNIVSFFPIPGFFRDGEKFGKIVMGPLFRSPTVDMNTTVGLALITTFMFLYAAIKTQGIIGYLKGLTAPIFVLLPLNIVGELAKPINISMRLFGNMFAGMVILGLLYKAAPWFIPAPLHLYFDLFSGIVQSFVFTMLTMVYISSSLGDAEPENV